MTTKLTPRHKAAMQALEGDRPSVTILRGYPGVGKTYLALEAGVKRLGGTLESNKKNGKKHIVFIRPNVPFADPLGFLPGTEEEKMDPWVQPVMDNLTEMGFTEDKVRDAIHTGVIKVVPLAFAQGRTFHDSLIIVDEAQNCTYDQLMLLWTRAGRYTSIVYCGDEKLQVAKSVRASGFGKLCEKCEPVETGVNIINFLKEDCLRSPLALKGIELWEE